jgi:diketogulonate reductase-like aldo/keto reductase
LEFQSKYKLNNKSFHGRHIKELLEYAEVKPQINQIEYHCWNQRKEQIKVCKENDIIVEGWGPLAKGLILKDEKIKKIAERYNKSIAQVCIRWTLQNGIICIPKSISEERLKENSNIFDFEINEDDMKELNSMDSG